MLILNQLRYMEATQESKCRNCSFLDSNKCTLFRVNGLAGHTVNLDYVCHFYLPDKSPITGFYTFLKDTCVEISRGIRDGKGERFEILFIISSEDVFRLKVSNKDTFVLEIVKVIVQTQKEVPESIKRLEAPKLEGEYSLQFNKVNCFILEQLWGLIS